LLWKHEAVSAGKVAGKKFGANHPDGICIEGNKENVAVGSISV